MKMRTPGRVAALVLAVLMLLPLISLPTFAEATEVDTAVRYDFENLSANSAITAGTASGFNASYTGDLPTFQKVLQDTDGNKFLRVPVVYNSDNPKNAPTNMDKSIYPNHPAYTADDEYVVIESSFRPHGNVTAAEETIELQIRKFSYDVTVENGSTVGGVAVTENATYTNGHYYNLLHINLNTGELSNSWGLNKTGAAGMKQNEWNTLKYVLNLKDASASVYVNGALYGTVDSITAQYYANNSWQYATNPTNISFAANNIILAKVNKIANSFVKLADAGAAKYANANYMDIDNICIDSVTLAELDGNFEPELYAGLLTTEPKASVRVSAPAGIRFATRVDTTKLDALYALLGDGLIDIELGTLIVPEDYLEAGTDFTFDALDAAGKDYVTVKATYGKYYSFDNDDATTHFVGSLINIKDKNIDRNFVGKGYVKVTFISGLTYVYYADGYVTNVQATAGKVLADGLDTTGWTESSKRILDAFANKTSFEEMYADVLTGLDVLALGDSLFSSSNSTGTTRPNQWVNAMGTKYDWNLTNLGVSGMTVSLTAGNTSSGKASMYDKLFNSDEPFHWNITDTAYLYPTSGNTYFQTGDFTGKTNEDVDLIIMEGGCNDYGYAVAAPLGEIGSTNGDTFIGAYNAIVQKLMEMYPNAKVLFLTTWHLGNQSRPDNENSIYYSSAVTRLYEQVYADNDRVFHIDMGDPKVSNVYMRDAAFRKEFCVAPGDSYHLNDKGMAELQRQMTPMIWELWVNNCLPAAPKEWTIPEVLAAEDGTDVIVSGTVTQIVEQWNDSFGNMNVTISDAHDNKLYLYRLATKVTLGDVITVTGAVGSYNGSKQIAAGATAVITGHVEIIPEYTEMTIPEVLAAEDGTDVIVSGTVTQIVEQWNDSFGNMNVTISDAHDNKLYLYRLATKVTLGDVITVTGTVGSYNGSKQIAAGATAEITDHVEIVVPKPEGELLDFSAQGYTNAQEVTTVNGTDFTVTFDKGSNKTTPKYYNSGTAIRLYGGGTMTIEAATGYTIKSITIQFGSGDGNNAITVDVGTLTDNVWTGDATVVVFTEGGTSGNRRFASVTVELAPIA